MLNVNGDSVEVEADDTTPLLWALREQLGLTGTIRLRNCPMRFLHRTSRRVAVRSWYCRWLPLMKIPRSPPLKACRTMAVTLCSRRGQNSTCHSAATVSLGMIMAVAGMLNATPDADDAQIDSQITNICRCGTFQRVREGVHLAKEITLKSKGERHE